MLGSTGNTIKRTDIMKKSMKELHLYRDYTSRWTVRSTAFAKVIKSLLAQQLLGEMYAEFLQQ